LRGFRGDRANLTVGWAAGQPGAHGQTPLPLRGTFPLSATSKNASQDGGSEGFPLVKSLRQVEHLHEEFKPQVAVLKWLAATIERIDIRLCNSLRIVADHAVALSFFHSPRPCKPDA
jgi:hypothetical protein